MDMPRLNAFINSLRRAENADARMHIRKDEEKPERKKDDGKNKDEDQDSALEDITTISVNALIGFLQNLLQEHSAPQASTDLTAPPKETPAYNPYAKAASAYARHEQSPPPKVMKETNAQNQSTQGTNTPDGTLTQSEKDMITQILKDARALSARGVENVRLERAESFLLSLQKAVQDASL